MPKVFNLDCLAEFSIITKTAILENLFLRFTVRHSAASKVRYCIYGPFVLWTERNSLQTKRLDGRRVDFFEVG